MARNENKTERVQLLMGPSEVTEIDDWGFKNRIRSRAEAMRRLCQIGLASEGIEQELVDGIRDLLSAIIELGYSIDRRDSFEALDLRLQDVLRAINGPMNTSAKWIVQTKPLRADGETLDEAVATKNRWLELIAESNSTPKASGGK